MPATSLHQRAADLIWAQWSAGTLLDTLPDALHSLDRMRKSIRLNADVSGPIPTPIGRSLLSNKGLPVIDPSRKMYQL